MAEQLIPSTITEPQRSVGTRARKRPPLIPWRLVPISILVVVLIFGPLVTGSPTAQNLVERLEPPIGFGGSSLGTDGLGRDLLARVIAGARTSLWVSLIAATGAAAIGIVLGNLAGMLGGWVDRIVTLLVETILAVPFITIGLMVTATIGQSALAIVLLLIGAGWITHARVLRMQAEAISHAEYVRASASMGAGRWHLAWRHVFPGLLPISIVVFFQQIGSMLLWSASLTWLGIGMPVETITLGGIVRDGQDLLYNGWWVSVSGGAAIVFIVLSLNLFADWLRIALDPTMKGHA